MMEDASKAAAESDTTSAKPVTTGAVPASGSLAAAEGRAGESRKN